MPFPLLRLTILLYNAKNATFTQQNLFADEGAQMT
jgi:hypothetical protein